MDNGTRLINALKNCVNLTTLTIDFHGSVFPADGKCNEELIIRKFLKTGVLFPKVQTLRLDGVSYRTLMNAFRLFDAPSLVNLAVEFWFPWLRGRPLIPKIASQIEYFVRTRSKCEATLRTFCLSDMAATLGELKIFLGALTTITHLTIQKMILIDNLPTGLDLFAWVKEVASSVSNLKVLHVHNLDAECGCLEGQAEFFEVGRKFHVHGGELILDGVSDGLWKS
ncbi:hypothetical protein EST38_g5040 [Candolleomyces aberdarensis]|uniref:Uncharacterized protein n=1 Tax=Candolleomyces aberdarensis TaxID=2316362 RepID=A0A4Q2DL33_9AGAR|nr:hypothetical protein EST38_g5040 [Candolleomyces aberdarensis]